MKGIAFILGLIASFLAPRRTVMVKGIQRTFKGVAKERKKTVVSLGSGLLASGSSVLRPVVFGLLGNHIICKRLRGPVRKIALRFGENLISVCLFSGVFLADCGSQWWSDLF